jgi:hypothetical protein
MIERRHLLAGELCMRALLTTEAPARTHAYARALCRSPPSHLSRALALRVNLVRPACNKSLNSCPPSETWRRPRQSLGERLVSACVY